MDFLENLARKLAPPGTQFDLFDTALSRSLAKPAVGPVAEAAPTLRQALSAVDPRQMSLPLKGRNPLLNTEVAARRVGAGARVPQAMPQLEMFPGMPAGQTSLRGVAPLVEAPAASQLVDPRQMSLPLKGRNPLLNTEVAAQQARAGARAMQAMPQLEMFPGMPAGQPSLRGATPLVEAPVAPRFVDLAQGELPLSGANPRPPLRGPLAPQQSVAPRVTLKGPLAPQQSVAPRVTLKGPLAPQQSVAPRVTLNGPRGTTGAAGAMPAEATAAEATAAEATAAEATAAGATDEIAETAKTLVGKTSRFPRLARILSGGGGGAIMPYSLQEISESGDPNSSIRREQEAAMENLRAAGSGIAQAWQQKGLDPTVKAIGQGAMRIAFGAPTPASGAPASGAPASGVAAVPDTSPMREGTLQELLQTPAAVAQEAPAATAAASSPEQANMLSAFEQVAKAYPNMSLRQVIALTNALPAASSSGAAANAPSRGNQLATERAIASIDREWKSMITNPKLTEAEKVMEDRRLRLEYAQLANVQAGIFNPLPEE